MGKYRFHTPDGVIDILPQDASVKRKIESDLRELFSGYGYSEVETPGIEYYDVYSSGDYVSAEDMYKMTDSDGLEAEVGVTIYVDIPLSRTNKTAAAVVSTTSTFGAATNSPSNHAPAPPSDMTTCATFSRSNTVAFANSSAVLGLVRP